MGHHGSERNKNNKGSGIEAQPLVRGQVQNQGSGVSSLAGKEISTA